VGYDFGVGREAPTFVLSATGGSQIDLKQYRGDWFPVLIFIPTQAPDAAQMLKQLSASADTLWGLRGQLVAVCDASLEEVGTLAAGVEGLAFPLLADDGRVAQLYGALKPDGTARPMVFIIDRAGKIVWTGEGAAAMKAPKLLAAFRAVVR